MDIIQCCYGYEQPLIALMVAKSITATIVSFIKTNLLLLLNHDKLTWYLTTMVITRSVRHTPQQYSVFFRLL